MSNLLNNALKFSDCFMNIKIIVNYYLRTQELLFTVIDNGIGIEKQDFKFLFTPFATLKQSININQSGAGLGLYICRSICEKLNGIIKIDDCKPDVGRTAFSVTIGADIFFSTNNMRI